MKKSAFHLIALGLFCSLATAQELWIEHVTVVSPERSKHLRDATVHIRDDKIVSISTRITSKLTKNLKGTPAEIIEGRGLYLAPGLIDSHVHTAAVNGMLPHHEAANPDIAVAAREQIPRGYLYFGFTTLVDLDSTPEAMAKWNSQPVHPDTYFCGGAPIVDGYPTMWEPQETRYQRRYLIVQRGEEAKAPAGIDPAAHTPEAVVARMKADGLYCVKTFYDERAYGPAPPPVPRLDTIRALVQAAHANRMPVFVHALSTEAQAFALEAGADVIAHGLWQWNGEEDAMQLTPKVQQVLDGVVQKKIGWQPTMQVMYGFRDLQDPEYLSNPLLKHVLPVALIEWYGTKEGQEFRVQTAQGLPREWAEMSAEKRWQQVRTSPAYLGGFARNGSAANYLALHGGQVIFGTDSPCAPLYTNPPGLNGWMEMQRLVEAGLTPAQVFRAATLANGQALGLAKEIGTVQAGKRANLLLLREDPTQSIQAYDKIEKVILHGRVFDRSDLAANLAASD